MDRPETATDLFDELVLHHWRHVFALAYGVMGNYQDAEDQTQEVFLKVYRSIPSLHNPHALSAWLTTITLNTCRDALAYQKRRLPTVSFEWSDQIEADNYSFAARRLSMPERAVERAELRRTIVDALARLDQTAQQTLVLRELEGRSYREIGQLLQLRPSAVKMRIRRARLSFRQQLGDLDPELQRIGGVNEAERSLVAVPE